MLDAAAFCGFRRFTAVHVASFYREDADELELDLLRRLFLPAERERDLERERVRRRGLRLRGGGDL